MHILSTLLPQVQLQFANQDPQSREAGAVGDCVGSQHVCNAFEEVLKHGLKPSWFGKGPSMFWPVVQRISRKQAVEYVNRYTLASTVIQVYVICLNIVILTGHYIPILCTQAVRAICVTTIYCAPRVVSKTLSRTAPSAEGGSEWLSTSAPWRATSMSSARTCLCYLTITRSTAS